MVSWCLLANYKTAFLPPPAPAQKSSKYYLVQDNKNTQKHMNFKLQQSADDSYENVLEDA